MKKLWGGRFQKATDEMVDDFQSSISFDQRMYRQDIEGSIAHAKMLAQVGVISEEEGEQIVQALNEILSDIEAGKVEFRIDAEDIHMNVEMLLTERIGTVGRKLHTARSRNDQVALDIRMYLKHEISSVTKELLDLEETLLALAKRYAAVYLPGYTHLQRAQPITFGHHLMAYFEMFLRDLQRLQDCFGRTNIMPLGSGALAGTTFPLDREFTARELGFADITRNSLDGVSDRDFVIEFIAAASMIMMHMSRFCEEIILWSSAEFAFVELDDAYSTGSSIMPQKKNPDVAELIRGKTGRVYGDLLAMLTAMKGLPLAYNKDMQEDKIALFDAIDTLHGCLKVFAPMLATMKLRQDNMEQAARGGFTNATDMADYLAKKQIPFREAHAIVGQAVFYCLERNKALEDLTLEEFRQFSPVFEEDIYKAISLEECVVKRNVIGGPAPDNVLQMTELGKKLLAGFYQESQK